MNLLAAALLTALVAVAIELTARTGWRIQSPETILLGTAVLCVLGGGVAAGLVSASLSVLFSLYLFDAPGELWLTPSDQRRIVELTIILFAFVFVAAAIRRWLALRERGGPTQAAAELREQERLFHSIFDQAAVGISQVGPDGRFRLVNPKLCSLYGYRPEEMLELTVSDVTHPLDRACDLDRFRRAVAGETDSYTVEKRNLTKDGRLIWVRLTASVVRNPAGDVEYLVGIIEDISDQKSAQEQLDSLNKTLEQQVAERTALAEQRADQLRALTVKLTRAEQQERRRLAEVLHDHIQQLLIAATMHAATLGEDLTDPSHRQRLKRLTEVLGEAIDASRSLAVDLCPPILHDRGLAAAIDWLARRTEQQHGISTQVDADPAADPGNDDLRDLLFRAVHELLLNVVKHSAATEVHVRMRSFNPEHVLIEVVDNGTGFDVEGLRQTTGTESFGLFNIGQRLKHVGGRMLLESAPGKGTCARVIAPQRLPPV